LQRKDNSLLTCSLIDDEWEIAKSSNPSCFKNIDKTKLPIKYGANKKYEPMIFQEYLQEFNEQMRKQIRKVLVLIDNASSHCKLNLNHITIKFYPPNCTSRL